MGHPAYLHRSVLGYIGQLEMFSLRSDLIRGCRLIPRDPMSARVSSYSGWAARCNVIQPGVQVDPMGQNAYTGQFLVILGS